MSLELLQQAKAIGDKIVLATQALQVWANVQQGIIYQADAAEAELADGKQPALPAEKMRAQGKALLQQIVLIEAKQAEVTAALAVHSFTPEQIAAVVPFLRSTCEMMRDTPDSGEDLTTLIATIRQRHTRPVTLF